MLRIEHTANATITRFGSAGVILRARESAPLTLELIREKVPSVFAETAHASRSPKYTYIPTQTILDHMDKEGFFPVEVRQGGTKDEEKRNFTKHLIKFRRQGVVPIVGDTFPEVALVNSHDGTSSYQMPCAWFRFTCTNGMYVQDRPGHGIKIPHRGDVSDIIEASFRVLEEFQEQGETIKEMAATPLIESEQLLLAETAASLRFDPDHRVNPVELITPRRQADREPTLWKTFNVLQERITNGLLDVRTHDTHGRPHVRRSRAVNNLNDNVKLNQALFTLAEKFLELKRAN